MRATFFPYTLLLVLSSASTFFNVRGQLTFDNFAQPNPAGVGVIDGTTANKTHAWIAAISCSIAISVLSLVCIILIGRRGLSDTVQLYFVGLGAGSMLGTAALNLIPEAAEEVSHLVIGALLIAGYFLGMGIELLLSMISGHPPHGESSDIEMSKQSVISDYFESFDSIGSIRYRTQPEKVASMVENPSLAWNNIIGDTIHNFADGVLIGLVFLSSVKDGLFVTLAVIFHEVPQEIADYFVLTHAGWSSRKAIFMNTVSGLAAVVGTILGLMIGESSKSVVLHCLPVVAGQFMFISMSHLIPEILELKWSRAKIGALLCVLAGVGLIGLFLLVPE